MLDGLTERLIDTLHSLLEPEPHESTLVGGSVVGAGDTGASANGVMPAACYSSAMPVRRIARMKKQIEIDDLQTKLTDYYDVMDLSDDVDDEVEIINQKPGSGKSEPVEESTPIAERLLLPLQKRHFPTMRAWFTSGMVDDYFSNLERRHPGKVLAICSSHGKKREDGGLTFFDRLADPTKYKQIKQAFHQADLIFWPIVIDAHWHLIIVEKSQTPVEVYMLDGFNTDIGDSGIWKEYAHRFVQLLMPELTEEEIIGEQIIVPNQTNAYDCGPAICLAGSVIANYYQENDKIPSDDEIEENIESDYTSGRLSIAKDLVDFHAHKKGHDKKLSRQAKPPSSSPAVIEIDDNDERVVPSHPYTLRSRAKPC